MIRAASDTMGFKTVRFYNFRNLRNSEVNIDAPEVFFVGENGQGKTNFLEALYLLCYGSSFRTRREQLLLTHGEAEMSVEGLYEPAPGDESRIQVKIVQGRKEIRLDGKQLKDRRELLTTVPCIVLSHDDIQFVTGAPEMRRMFFNQTLILYDHSFLDTLRTYNRILRLRNAALRDNRRELLDVYDRQLATAGLEISDHRKRIVNEFTGTFTETFRGISGLPSPLTIRYAPSWKNGLTVDEIVSILAKNRYNELSLGMTTTGPHRDRFLFVREGTDFSKIGSTGQLRLISLILKVAQARFYRERTGRKPVLLVDDVLLELDLGKRRRFLETLPEYEQAFFTFHSEEQYAGYRSPNVLVYRVREGAFETGRAEAGS